MQISNLAPGAVWRRVGRIAAGRTPQIQAAPTVHRWRRYARLSWFIAKTLLHLLWWDVLLNRPVLAWWRTLPQPRWRRIAGAFRTLASETGGVLVKLGQFLSLRFDLLPAEVTTELASLRDQMPAAPLPAIVAALEADLGRPLAELFAWFAPQPVASASLGQVHLARLHSGEQVVVKVLRPGVRAQVEMDLRAIKLLRHGLGLAGLARPGSDVDRLLAEFASVTRRELDLANEGQNAERFARDFADDGRLYLPKVYWQYSGASTLTMENVSYIKLDNIAALEDAGIDSTQVAHELARVMLQQIFITHFLHADPHPGNLFVKPLPHPDEARTLGFAPNEPVPYFPGRPFQLVLIDCGMAVEIPERARLWLRDFVIGLGLRDARRIVQSYVSGGLLRPGVDPARVEQLTATLLDHFQGMLIGLMPDLQQDETRQFFAEYHDLVEHYPFRIPLDLLFMYRSLGIVGALVKALDPDFDLSRAAAPFARQLVWQEYQKNWRHWVQTVMNLGQTLVTPPVQLDQVLSQAQALFALPAPLAGMLNPPTYNRAVPAGQQADAYPALQRLDHTVRRLGWIGVAVCLLMASGLWQIRTAALTVLQTGATLDFVGVGLMMVALVFLLRALSSSK